MILILINKVNNINASSWQYYLILSDFWFLNKYSASSMEIVGFAKNSITVYSINTGNIIGSF